MNLKHPSQHQALAELVEWQVGPCVSIYIAIGRGPNPATENGARLKALCQQAVEELRKAYPKHEAQELLNKVMDVAANDSFWNQEMKSLAIFCAPDYLKVVPLARPTDDYLAVADSFHTKPLVRATQFAGRFHVLCVSQRRVAMYEGSQDDFQELDLKRIPANIVEALKAVHGDWIQTFNATDGSVDREGGNKSADDLIDTSRFFRIVDRAVWESYSRDAGLPLILCALDEYQYDFHRASRNPHLLDEGIKLNPDSINDARLHQEAWKLIQPYYQRQVEQLADDFRAAKAHRHGSDDLREIGHAVAESRISVLLVDDSKTVGGKVDLATGNLVLAPIDQPDVDDVLDDLAEAVMKTGGQVLVLPPDQMPTDTGAAAIYRY